MRIGYRMLYCASSFVRSALILQVLINFRYIPSHLSIHDHESQADPKTHLYLEGHTIHYWPAGEALFHSSALPLLYGTRRAISSYAPRARSDSPSGAQQPRRRASDCPGPLALYIMINRINRLGIKKPFISGIACAFDFVSAYTNNPHRTCLKRMRRRED